MGAGTEYRADGEVRGILLLPDDATSAQFVALSAELAGLAPSHVRLGPETSLPHITIAHFEATEAAALALWDEHVSGPVAEMAAEAAALYLRLAKGRVWVGVDIRRSPALDAIHGRVLALCERRGLPVLTEFGDRFWPHVTLGQWDTSPAARLPVERVPTTPFPTRAVLATMGVHGTAAAVLAESRGGVIG